MDTPADEPTAQKIEILMKGYQMIVKKLRQLHSEEKTDEVASKISKAQVLERKMNSFIEKLQGRDVMPDQQREQLTLVVACMENKDFLEDEPYQALLKNCDEVTKEGCP